MRLALHFACLVRDLKGMHGDITRGFMGFYDEEETAKDYIALTEDYDGSLLIDVLSKHLPEHSTVLELGMGPGQDLDVLKKRYLTTGSDNSNFFLDRYRKLHPDADLLELDAVTLTTERRFDCICSNKVLHHLSPSDLRRSLARQRMLLNEGGLVLHSSWSGDGVKEMKGLTFQYYTDKALEELFGHNFEIIDLVAYEELEEDDSFYVVAQAKVLDK